MTMPYDTKYDHDSDLALKPQELTPPLYNLVIHNDDYTTMDFVVFVLMEVFDYAIERAIDVMMCIHNQGKATVAQFPKDIAEMKILQVEKLASDAEFPLLITMHKD